MNRLCTQVVGAAVGALLSGDEQVCGREARLLVKNGRKVVAHVCVRHAVRFRRMAGYRVEDIE